MSVVGVALVVVFEVNNEEEEEEEEEAFVLSVFWPSSNCAELRGESLEDSVGSAIVGCFSAPATRVVRVFYGKFTKKKKKNRIYFCRQQGKTLFFHQFRNTNKQY
jgi:hypothetical protein